MTEDWGVMGAFVHERWLSGQGTATAKRRLRRFLAHELAEVPFYAEYAGRPLTDLPIVDKATMLGDFAAFNRFGITLDQAQAVAEAAEVSRNFAPTLADDVTVGLSSGTSGRTGVFLVSAEERRRWAGVIFAELLSRASLRAMSRRPLQVVMFLRANSNLYETLGGRRVEFRYFDLTHPLPDDLGDLGSVDALIAPPSVLRVLADRPGRIHPLQVISVAETLEPDDAHVLQHRFGVPIEQVYQASEGLFGFGCVAGRIHLNDKHVWIEQEWIDDEHFVPVVTDVTRTTQLVARYRLDDVLHVDRPLNARCRCGRRSRSVGAVLGRQGDVLDRPGPGGRPVPVFADVLRHAVAPVPGLHDYRIEQHAQQWRLAVRADVPERAAADLRRNVDAAIRRLNAQPPRWARMDWPDEPTSGKRRRVKRVS